MLALNWQKRMGRGKGKPTKLLFVFPFSVGLSGMLELDWSNYIGLVEIQLSWTFYIEVGFEVGLVLLAVSLVSGGYLVGQRFVLYSGKEKRRSWISGSGCMCDQCDLHQIWNWNVARLGHSDRKEEKRIERKGKVGLVSIIIIIVCSFSRLMESKKDVYFQMKERSETSIQICPQISSHIHQHIHIIHISVFHVCIHCVLQYALMPSIPYSPPIPLSLNPEKKPRHLLVSFWIYSNIYFILLQKDVLLV